MTDRDVHTTSGSWTDHQLQQQGSGPQPEHSLAGPRVMAGGAVRRCRSCGCTDEDCSACVAASGEPCGWVERDLCSRCVGSPAAAAVPSPVPAGTERLGFDDALRAELERMGFPGTRLSYRETQIVQAALAAAVVSSSPATPEGGRR